MIFDRAAEAVTGDRLIGTRSLGSSPLRRRAGGRVFFAGLLGASVRGPSLGCVRSYLSSIYGKEGANTTLSAARESMKQLEGSFDTADDDIFETFSPLVPRGGYQPLLLEVQPELVAPNDERDYFAHEQVATWGVDSFWGFPENPRSFYYRTFETRVDSQRHLFEFVVPMVPPGWNDPEQVGHYLDLIRDGVTPTAVSLSTLDVCQPAIDDESTDYYVHWGLSHFLFDGHHKFEAAARTGRPVRLLALVSLDGGLASTEDVSRIPELLARPRSARRPGHCERAGKPPTLQSLTALNHTSHCRQ